MRRWRFHLYQPFGTSHLAIFTGQIRGGTCWLVTPVVAKNKRNKPVWSPFRAIELLHQAGVPSRFPCIFYRSDGANGLVLRSPATNRIAGLAFTGSTGTAPIELPHTRGTWRGACCLSSHENRLSSKTQCWWTLRHCQNSCTWWVFVLLSRRLANVVPHCVLS